MSSQSVFAQAFAAFSELSAPVKAASLIVGLPALVILLNVLYQLVSSHQMETYSAHRLNSSP